MILSKDLFKTISAELDVALAEIGQRHGVSLHVNGGTFYDTNGSMKIAIATLDKSSKPVSVASRDLAIYANAVAYVLKCSEQDLNRIVTLSGMKVVLTGYRRSAPKRPFIVTDLDTSKEYLVTEEQLVRAFATHQTTEKV